MKTVIKNIGIAILLVIGFISISNNTFAQNYDEEVVDHIPLNNNLGFDWDETAIVTDAKEIKARLKKAKMNYFGPTDQYILIKLYAKAKGCTQPYFEINLNKGHNELVVEYKLIQRGFCKKDQSLSNTILIAKAPYENDKIILTTPVELQTTTY